MLDLGAPLQDEGLAADPVDGLVARGRDDPRDRVVGRAPRGPLVDGQREGVLEGVLGEIEVAHQADERRQDAPVLAMVEGADLHDSPVGREYPTGRPVRAHPLRGISTIGRTSMEPP